MLFIGRSDSSQCHCLQLLVVQAHSHHQDPCREEQPWTPPPAPHRDSPHCTAVWWCTDGGQRRVSGGVLCSWSSAGRGICGGHPHSRVSMNDHLTSLFIKIIKVEEYTNGGTVDNIAQYQHHLTSPYSGHASLSLSSSPSLLSSPSSPLPPLLSSPSPPPLPPLPLSLPSFPSLLSPPSPPLPPSTSRSICLMLQAALPCLLFAPETSRLLLKGGTNAEMAPPIDYLVQVGHKHLDQCSLLPNITVAAWPACQLSLSHTHKK